MTLRVAFLRAINVGKRRVTMDRLRAPFEELGFEDVSTFIASGNVVFRAAGRTAALETRIERALGVALGFDVPAFVRSTTSLTRIVEDHPFAGSDDAQVHVGFLKAPVTPATRRALEAAGNDVDRLTARGSEVYWDATAGLGRATVSGAAIEKLVGGPTTLRSMKMLRRLLASVT